MKHVDFSHVRRLSEVHETAKSRKLQEVEEQLPLIPGQTASEKAAVDATKKSDQSQAATDILDLAQTAPVADNEASVSS